MKNKLLPEHEKKKQFSFRYDSPKVGKKGNQGKKLETKESDFEILISHAT